MFDTPLNALNRDTKGFCEGECRNIVREGEEERQQTIDREQIEVADYYPTLEEARSRTIQPGVFGGHV